MSDLVKSGIRTLVPWLVAYLVAIAARWGLDIPAEDLKGVLEGIVFGVYYLVVRWLEDKFPWVGWMLGVPSPPHYDGNDEGS